MGKSRQIFKILALAIALYFQTAGGCRSLPIKTLNKSIHGGPMLLVPAGNFIMGMSVDEAFMECQRHYINCNRDWFTNEEPAHRVYLDAFYIDKYEVTQGEYGECVKSGNCRANEKYDGFTSPSQPVVGVSWDEVRDYCQWAGKRLPSEAEWEKAARGTKGRIYPWGDKFDGKRVNFCDRKCPIDWALRDVDDGYSQTAPVGSYPKGASPYGALDLAGNAWEWVADWYDEHYYQNSPDRNPKGPEKGFVKILRGGAWSRGTNVLRGSDREPMLSESRYNYIGFRCARDF